MRRAEEFAKTCAVALAVLCLAACGGRSGKRVSIGGGLQGPSGTKATLYASGLPLMSAFAFDSRGRLWVTTSGATTHGSDGVFLISAPGAKPVRIASIRGPLGLVWVGSTLIVSSL